MARGNVIDDEVDEGSEEDQDFDAEAEDSDTSPKKGKKRKTSAFIDEAASEDDDEVLRNRSLSFRADAILALGSINCLLSLIRREQASLYRSCFPCI